MIVKAEGPSGRAKIHSDDPKHALGLVQYLRTIGYKAWIEDTNGKEIEKTALSRGHPRQGILQEMLKVPSDIPPILSGAGARKM